MTQPDWTTAALHSEIAVSTAYGGVPTAYPTFTHIHNSFVPWAGDFNRAVGIQCTSYNSFLAAVAQVEDRHQTLRLDPPTRFDLHPSTGAEPSWVAQLANHNSRVETALFFQSPTQQIATTQQLTLYTPTPEEYTTWYHQRQQAQSFYTVTYWDVLLPLQLRFIQTFQPYWLLYNSQMVGWVYCAVLGGYSRLFEVEISESWRGRGFGTALLHLLQTHCYQQGITHILLQSGERLRPFYERAGFQICVRNRVVWRG
ncbi:MAG: GNAT family N-acetyltransferase [Caldilineaceae bacterium]